MTARASAIGPSSKPAKKDVIHGPPAFMDLPRDDRAPADDPSPDGGAHPGRRARSHRLTALEPGVDAWFVWFTVATNPNW
jgi:hypothetical protein